MLATRYWLPATRYWLPATRYWLPATGYWLLGTGYFFSSFVLLCSTCFVAGAGCKLHRATCGTGRAGISKRRKPRIVSQPRNQPSRGDCTLFRRRIGYYLTAGRMSDVGCGTADCGIRIADFGLEEGKPCLIHQAPATSGQPPVASHGFPRFTLHERRFTSFAAYYLLPQSRRGGLRPRGLGAGCGGHSLRPAT